jgi:hypothetical protein
VETSSWLKLLAIVAILIVGLFFVIPIIDYSVIEPEKFSLGDTAVKVLDEYYTVGDYVCVRTIEGKIVEPVKNGHIKWFRAVVRLSDPPFVFQVVRFSHSYSDCEEWIIVDELDAHYDSEKYCLRVKNVLATCP